MKPQKPFLSIKIAWNLVMGIRLFFARTGATAVSLDKSKPFKFPSTELQGILVFAGVVVINPLV